MRYVGAGRKSYAFTREPNAARRATYFTPEGVTLTLYDTSRKNLLYRQ